MFQRDVLPPSSGRNVSQTINQQQAKRNISWPTLGPRGWKGKVTPKRRALSKLHEVTTQKTIYVLLPCPLSQVQIFLAAI
jgi:hypothetical protein